LETTLEKLFNLILDQGTTVTILVAAFIYRDRQADIERKRSDEKYNKLFEIVEKLTDKISQNKYYNV